MSGPARIQLFSSTHPLYHGAIKQIDCCNDVVGLAYDNVSTCLEKECVRLRLARHPWAATASHRGKIPRSMQRILPACGTWLPSPLHLPVIVSFTTVTTGISSRVARASPVGGDNLVRWERYVCLVLRKKPIRCVRCNEVEFCLVWEDGIVYS